MSSSIQQFSEMDLHPQLITNVNLLGFTQPTPVQLQFIPNALISGDWIVSSQTGSGKTAAFLLPAITKLLNKDERQKAAFEQKDQPQAASESGYAPAKRKFTPNSPPAILVLCPTRELAQQVTNDAISYVKGIRGIRIASVVGGMPYGLQRKQLDNANVIIATPGRLLDWVKQKEINLSTIDHFILDEADRMLDLGFMDDIAEIASYAKNRKQTFMFSATFTARETKLAQNLMKSPQFVTLTSGQQKHDGITQHLLWADNSNHLEQLLLHWIADPQLDQAVVFTSTQTDTEDLAQLLIDRGILASALHGGMPQAVRNRRLDSLRKGRTKILVATDVAARGIDVPTITHVFNYGLPMKAEDYVHRIGRTGRAGRQGTAVTFALHQDQFKIRQIERYIDSKINVSKVEGLEPKLTLSDIKPARKRPQNNHRGGKGKPSFSDATRRTDGRSEGRSEGRDQRRAASPSRSGEGNRSSTAARDHKKSSVWR